jgi:CHRD domain-containing protein
MRIRLLLIVATFALVTAAAVFAMSTETVKLSAMMNARQVVPNKPKGDVARARGTLKATLSGSGARWKLSWKMTYRKLDHPRLVIADIHYGKPRKFGPVIVRLCGPCKSGQHGRKKVSSLWVDAIERGNSFITLITGKNPNGEIRGQIKAH